ncbi:MAG: hypothetical protein ACRDUB_10645, partial [Mycobacterium sp.]
MSSAQHAAVVPVTARTEYTTGRHRTAAIASATALVAGMLALVGLNYAGAPESLTAAVVAVLVTATLGGVAYGRLGKPSAVLITVDDDTVYLGAEDHGIVSYPLSSLNAVRRSGPADTTSATVNGRHLTVRGRDYLELAFASETNPGTAGDEWRVAVVGSDPAAAEILTRLQATLPDVDDVADAEPGADATFAQFSGARIADAGTDEAARRLWEQAARRHDDILGAYGAYELDPAMLLRYPAITDVTVEHTQTFHVALDEAGALRTDAYPGNRGLADAYQRAVVALRRAWIACESHGKKVGTTYLEPADRTELDTAFKLYTHATSSTTPAEQAIYYGRVREIVTKLADRG